MLPIRVRDRPQRSRSPVLAALVCLATALAAPPPLRADGTAVPDPQAANFALSESYFALRSLDARRRPTDEPQNLANLSLPFRSVVVGLLGHAGIELPRDAPPEAGISIAIDSEGTTRGQLYDAAVQSQRIRELRYSDARVAGRIQIETAEGVAERTFAGVVAPAVSIIGIVDGRDPRRDPVYAPFREAFEAPGGFLDGLGDLVLEVWGEAPLRAALEDRDPLVRETARRALGLTP